MRYHDGTRLTGVLTDSNNKILSNKTVNICINAVKYTRTTNGEGIFSIGLGLNSGKYLTTIEFNGDKKYNYSSKEILVNIQPSINANNLIKYYKNDSQFYATVLDYDGNPVINSIVEMNINKTDTTLSKSLQKDIPIQATSKRISKRMLRPR